MEQGNFLLLSAIAAFVLVVIVPAVRRYFRRRALERQRAIAAAAPATFTAILPIPMRGSVPVTIVAVPGRARPALRPIPAPAFAAAPATMARRRVHSLVRDPRAARLGIVLMTVLGPCRGLDRSDAER